MQYNISYREKDKGIQFIISYKDHEGKWRQKSRQGFTRKKDAKKAADKMLEKLKEKFELQRNLNSEFEGITFKEFVDTFMEHEKLYKEMNTIDIYKTAIEKFSSLNNLELDKINSLNIQNCVDGMVKKGLGPSTIKIYTSKLITIFNNALEPHHLILQNPVQNIKIPETKKSDKIKALTKAELNDLLNKITNESEHLASLIAATCGLRLGEILGLTWNNINFVSSTLTINKQWKKMKNGKMGLGTVKSKNSNRTVPIPPKTLKALKIYKKNHPTDLNNRVFLYKSASSLGKYITDKYKKAGYNISIHDLRHTYATMLIGNGTDFKTVAKLMGHDVEQTLRTYSHVTDDMIEKVTKTINNIF